MWWTLLLGYALIVLLAAFYQRRLIYFPARLGERAAEQAARQNGFTPWRDSSGQIIGWKLAASGPAQGSVLIAHGNAGCALDRDYLAQPIHEALPLDVFVLEYPGYGARPGAPGMGTFLAAAEQALNRLPADLPVYLVSESIGAGVVAHLAKVQPDRINGLALFVPYDDLAAVGQSAMPFLPVHLVLRDRFQPAKWLRVYQGPIQVVLAGADEIIPPKFGQRLYDGYAGPKRLQVVPAARHNEVAEQPPACWRDVFAFWEQIPRGPNLPAAGRPPH